MPVSVASPAFLWGIVAGLCAGAGLVAGVCGILCAHRRQIRRTVLGFAAQSLVDALEALQQEGELGYHHIRQVGNIRDLAAAVARVAME